MRKILVTVIISIIVLLSVPVFAKDEAVLVVFEDEYEAIMMKEILTAMEKNADYLNVSNYESSVLEKYDYVILFTEAPLIDALEREIRTFCVGDHFLSIPGIEIENIDDVYHFEIGFADFKETVEFEEKIQLISHNYYTDYKKYGYILHNEDEYSFGIITDNILYVPYLSEYNISVFAFSGMLKEYFGDTKSYETYIKYNEVYGFSDNNQIESVANAFYAQGVPYILGVMPQLENIDYPAYNRFVETISYSQSRDASIVLEKPLSGNIENEKYKNNKEKLLDYGILVLNNKVSSYIPKYDVLSKIVSTNKNSSLPIDTVISYSLFSDWQKADEIVKKVKESGLAISSYRKKFSSNGFSSINIDVADDFIFKENVEYETKFNYFFEHSNRILIIVVSLGVLMVIILIVIGVRIYKTKYYKRN